MDEIFIIIGLILLNGVFSMSEVALISARKSRLATDEKKGSKGARIALNLANDPDRFLSTVQIGITLIGILTGIFSGNKIAAELTALLTGMGLAQAYAAPLAQALIVIVVTFLTIVFGELVPKRIGLSMAESVARTLSRPMQWLSVVTLPFVWLLSRTTELIFNLLGIRETDNKVTEEEIKSIIQEGTADGEVQPVEQDIVQRVFLLGDLKVSSIMTHRSDLVWLDTEMSTEEMRRVILDDLFEMYPVCDGDLDHVIGTINLKEVMTHFNDNPLNLKELARQAVYFHENMHVYKVLEQMKAQKISRGLVCDEFGSCTGIITLRDIMEALVGSVEDADEDDPDIIKRNGKEGWLVDGQCNIFDFLNYFHRDDQFESSDYQTVAGLLLKQLHHIPKSGETLTWKDFTFEVVDMDGVRIDKVLVTLATPSDGTQPDAPAEGKAGA